MGPPIFPWCHTPLAAISDEQNFVWIFFDDSIEFARNDRVGCEKYEILNLGKFSPWAENTCGCWIGKANQRLYLCVIMVGKTLFCHLGRIQLEAHCAHRHILVLVDRSKRCNDSNLLTPTWISVDGSMQSGRVCGIPEWNQFEPAHRCQFASVKWWMRSSIWFVGSNFVAAGYSRLWYNPYLSG